MDNGYLKSMIETFETELHRKNNMILTLLNINTCTSNNDLKEECNVDKINLSLQPIPINIDTPISNQTNIDKGNKIYEPQDRTSQKIDNQLLQIRSDLHQKYVNSKDRKDQSNIE